VDTDDINGFAIENAVREVLDTVHLLRPGYASTDDGDIRIVETNSELEMVRHVTEPGFTGRNGPDAAKGLVLEIDALSESVTEQNRMRFRGDEQE
jgi:hypothetical protein